MKKALIAAIVLLLALLLVVTGCSGNTNKGEPKASPTASGQPASSVEATESNLTAPGEFPIVKEPVELSVLIKGDSRVEDFQTNEFTKYYEELTNVKLKFEVAPEGSYQETLNLRLASGDLPDIILNMGVSKVQEMIYGQQGMFLPLNDLIETQGYYIKQMIQKKPEYYKAMQTTNGNIYSLPHVSECYHCSLAVKMWVYQPWLDELGLSIPATTEDFYQMLKKFKEGDPNKNGKADEIPLAGSPAGWNSSVEMFIMNAFVYTPPEKLYVSDRKVVASFDQPAWKEGLQYLHKLYAEGLIAGESFTQDGQQFRKMGENPEVPILGTFPAGWFGVGTEYNGPSGRSKQYTSIPPFKGPEGLQQAVSFPYPVSSGVFVITKNAKNPEVAMRWADGFFKEEVLVRALSGVEDRDWKMAEPGTISIDGREAKYQNMATFGELGNYKWYQAYPAYLSNEIYLSYAPAAAVHDEDLEVILYNQSKDNYEPYRAPLEMVLPPLYFSEEQSTELADLQKTITDYVSQMTARFITGDASLDKEWDSYLNTLKKMNLERYIAIQQEAFDALK